MIEDANVEIEHGMDVHQLMHLFCAVRTPNPVDLASHLQIQISFIQEKKNWKNTEKFHYKSCKI